MAVVFDPHQTVAGNLQKDEAVNVVGTKYRLLFPKYGSFYDKGVIVKSGSKVLNPNTDYVFTHVDITAIERTARIAHGSIWILNKSYTSNFTVTYHPIGLYAATDSEIAAERAKNELKVPTRLQWSQVVGIRYFPPVDIQFTRTPWNGEAEFLTLLKAISEKTDSLDNIPDPIANNSYGHIVSGTADKPAWGKLEYNKEGGYFATSNIDAVDNCYAIIGQRIGQLTPQIGDYRVAIRYHVPSYTTRNDPNSLRFEFFGKGDDYFTVYVIYDPVLQAFAVRSTVYQSTAQGKPHITLATFPYAKSAFNKDITYTIVRTDHAKITLKISTSDKLVGSFLLDADALPALLLNAGSAAFSNPATEMPVYFKGQVLLKFYFSASKGEYFAITSLSGADFNTAAATGVDEALERFSEIIDSNYRLSPAIEHVKKKNNPHGVGYGSARAVEAGGIAADTKLLNGNTLEKFTDTVNQKGTKLSDFTQQIPTVGVDYQLGQINSGNGVARIAATSKAKLTDGVETFIQAGDVVRIRANNELTISAGSTKTPEMLSARINYKLGTEFTEADVLTRLPKPALPTAPTQPLSFSMRNVSFFINIPAGASGWEAKGSLIYSPQYEYNRRWGFTAEEFPATVTTADRLIFATPKLIKSLDNVYKGKLLKSKAKINGHLIGDGLVLTRLDFGLDKVQNLADSKLPVSNAYLSAADKYSPANHVHDYADCSVVVGTDTSPGLVQLSTDQLANDKSTALTADVAHQVVNNLNTTAQYFSGLDPDAIIDIICYGNSGTGRVTDIGISGFKITLPKKNYYVKRHYVVPQTTFDLAASFPGTTGNWLFVYANIVDNTGVYQVYSTQQAETDTMTYIGRVRMNGTTSEHLIYNTTRLGDFREWETHLEATNVHGYRTPTTKEFFGSESYSFLTGGGEWSAGLSRNIGDPASWRSCNVSGVLGYSPRWGEEVADHPTGGVMTFFKTRHRFKAGSDLLFAKTLMSYTGLTNLTVKWAPTSESVSGTGANVAYTVAGHAYFCIAGFRGSDGFFNTVGILLTKDDYIHWPGNVKNMVGLVFNYGTGRQVVVPTSSVVSPGWNLPWSSLGGEITVNSGKVVHTSDTDWTTSSTITGKIVMGNTIEFTITDKTVKIGDTAETEISKLTGSKFDTTTWASLPERYLMIGGKFPSTAFTCLVGNNDTSFGQQNKYSTTVNFIEGLSGMDRTRFVRKTLTDAQLALTDENLRVELAKNFYNSNRQFNGDAVFVDADQLLINVNRTNKYYTLVAIRN